MLIPNVYYGYNDVTAITKRDLVITEFDWILTVVFGDDIRNSFATKTQLKEYKNWKLRSTFQTDKFDLNFWRFVVVVVVDVVVTVVVVVLLQLHDYYNFSTDSFCTTPQRCKWSRGICLTKLLISQTLLYCQRPICNMNGLLFATITMSPN